MENMGANLLVRRLVSRTAIGQTPTRRIPNDSKLVCIRVSIESEQPFFLFGALGLFRFFLISLHPVLENLVCGQIIKDLRQMVFIIIPENQNFLLLLLVLLCN